MLRNDFFLCFRAASGKKNFLLMMQNKYPKTSKTAVKLPPNSYYSRN